MIIGMTGLIGSGKGTVAKYLVSNHGFREDSFASTLKDICATLFNWDREMLEGATPEARKSREVPDEWWSKQLGIPSFTPRLALQLVGTETLRENFNPDIWLLSTLSRYAEGENLIISDVRFPNEIQMVKDRGIIVRVERGDRPEWWEVGKQASLGDKEAVALMKNVYKVHASEWSWVGFEPDYIITNNGTLAELEKQVEDLVANYNF